MVGGEIKFENLFFLSDNNIKKSPILICPHIIWKGDNILILFFFTFSSKRQFMSPLRNCREDKSYRRHTKESVILPGNPRTVHQQVFLYYIHATCQP